jgi:hypothetical protein
VDSTLAQSEYYTRDVATSREPCWAIQAGNLIKDFVSIDIVLAKQGMDKLHDFWAKVRNDLANHPEYASLIPTLKYCRSNYFRAHGFAPGLFVGGRVQLPLGAYLDACTEMKIPAELVARIVTVITLAPNTRSSVIRMVNGILCDIAAEEFANCVSLSPFEPPEKWVFRAGDAGFGEILVYIPTVSPSEVAVIVGRCIKAKFLEFVFTRTNKVRPFAYIVDEAQRFITAEEQDGEQRLLNSCRPYRTMVVLSTQSITSLKVRLESTRSAAASSLQVILNNCSNALYFRSRDVSTQESVRARIHECPVHGRPHVVKVRPLTSLSIGGCHAPRANGSWGLFQVHL